MRTVVASHELLTKDLDLESLSVETGHVSISVSSGARRFRCPVRGRGASRVHSRYSRSVSDLPWHGISVTLAVRARRTKPSPTRDDSPRSSPRSSEGSKEKT